MTSKFVDEYVKALTPTAYDKTVVADRRKKMEQAVGVSVLDAGSWFESGSWSHGTALKGHSDVDYMAWASGKRPTYPSSALASLKSALTGSHWSISDLRISSPTVKVKFHAAPHFEVVPAWYKSSIGRYNVYLIPGPGNQWVESAPRAHMDFVIEQNNRLGGKVKQLARLLKQWKVYTGAPVSSFYLEMRVAEYAKNEKSIFYHLDLMFLVDRLISYELRDMNDPTGMVNRINAVSSDDNRRTALKLLKEASGNLRAAYAVNGQAGKEIEYWMCMSSVFGPSFPIPRW